MIHVYPLRTVYLNGARIDAHGQRVVLKDVRTYRSLDFIIGLRGRDYLNTVLVSDTKHHHLVDMKTPHYFAVHKGTNKPGTEDYHLENYNFVPATFEEQARQEALSNIDSEPLSLKLHERALNREIERQSALWREAQIAEARLREGRAESVYGTDPAYIAAKAQMVMAKGLLDDIQEDAEELFPVNARAKFILAILHGMGIIAEGQYHSEFEHLTDKAIVADSAHDIACDGADALVASVMALSQSLPNKARVVRYLEQKIKDDRLLEQTAWSRMGIRDSSIDSKRYLRRGHRFVTTFSTATEGLPTDAVEDTTIRETLTGPKVSAAVTALFTEGPIPS